MPSSSSRVLERPPFTPTAPGGAPPRNPRTVVRPVEPVLTEERLMALEREAYEAGFASGERAGRETGEATARQLEGAIRNLVDEIGAARDALVAETEHEVLHLAVAVARAVLGYEVAADHPVLVAGVAAAREHFSPRTPLAVRINPADRPILEAHRAALVDGLTADFDVVADPAVGRGGARVEGAGKVIDAELLTRFEEVVAALMAQVGE
jgi:flagellar assembly protein FliH